MLDVRGRRTERPNDVSRDLGDDCPEDAAMMASRAIARPKPARIVNREGLRPDSLLSRERQRWGCPAWYSGSAQ